jgi:hypothetical protein
MGLCWRLAWLDNQAVSDMPQKYGLPPNLLSNAAKNDSNDPNDP